MNYREIVDRIPKEEFHKKLIRGVARMSEFGGLVTFGVEAFSEEKKDKVRNALSEVGITDEAVLTDDGLQNIAIEIAARSVKVR